MSMNRKRVNYKNETKRLGETPEFDEHTNEDGYFAAKEHELMAAMKVEYLKGRAARREAQMATGPKCSGRFQQYKFMGYLLERCEYCEGIWLNKGELKGILRQHGRGPLGVFLDRCFSRAETPTKVRNQPVSYRPRVSFAAAIGAMMQSFDHKCLLRLIISRTACL